MSQIPPTSCDAFLTPADRVAMDQAAQPSPGPPPFRIVRDYDGADLLATAKRTTGAFCLTDAAPADVPWLWPDRIPLGHVTLLVSDPGAGKSLLALDIAAHVSSGAPWPHENHEAPMQNDEPPANSSLDIRHSSFENHLTPPSPFRLPPSSVLLINIEDHFQNTIRPRLDALGADCSRIIGWTYARGDTFKEPHLFAMTRDLDRLSTLVEAMQDCRLVILDPITALLGDASDQSSADVWKLLAALARLAGKHNFAVLAVSHFRKKEGAAIHRAMGSLAYVAAARSVWTIAKDPADDHKRLLLPVKNNLVSRANGLAFTIESNATNSAPILRWLPDPIEATADAAVTSARMDGRPDQERQFAMNWLLERLALGPSPSIEVRKAAEANGISLGTLRRVFRKLGAVAFQPTGIRHGPWMWKLTGSVAQNPVGEFCATDQMTG